MAVTHQQFESRVAAPRLLRLLAGYGITATFFVPGPRAERRRNTVTTIAEAGHEIGHHSHSHRPPTELTDVEDRAEFERGLRALDARGIEPVGYRAPMWSATWRIPGLVREYGLRYDSGLMDDDVPYIIDTPLGNIAEIPRTGPWTTGNGTRTCPTPRSATTSRGRTRRSQRGAPNSTRRDATTACSS